MPDSGWPRSSKRWDAGSNSKGHVFLGRQWLCQEIHKDGIGCGLAEDEGSQGDQEDSVTDQRPPAGWLDFLHLREFGLNEAQPWEDEDEAGGQASDD